MQCKPFGNQCTMRPVKGLALQWRLWTVCPRIDLRNYRPMEFVGSERLDP